MTDEKTYNGWSNRETWLVNLWFGNEEGSWRGWDERAREIVSDIMESWEPSYEWETHESEARARLAGEMKDWLEEEMVHKLGEASLLSDLLSGAIGEVDWMEITESWLGEIEKPEGWLTRKEESDEKIAD